MSPLFLVLWILGASAAAFSQEMTVSPQLIEDIAFKIFRNECGGNRTCLTAWNRGEEFASLGIGHFIWYPEDKEGPYRESFPLLLDFLKNKGAQLPGWLDTVPFPDCPWNSRAEFMADFNSETVRALRDFLQKTVPLQAEFLVLRLQKALPKILAAVPEEERSGLEARFERIAEAPNGLYALTDYVNFKGEGILESERYDGQGWGLLQVLQGMETQPDEPVIAEFVRSAEDVLTRRVKNAPPERREERWLRGWLKRVRTYLPE